MTRVALMRTGSRGRQTQAWRDAAISRATVTSFVNLIESVQDNTSSDDEAVVVLSHILATRKVVLGGVRIGLGA